jgi:hypothetical protein
MGGYSFQVGIDLVTCNDTESIHSSDKFALAGAVITDSTRTGFVMPTIRINSGEQREYDRDIRLVFNGIANVPTLGIVLQAWDLDQNDNWVENKEDIVKVSGAIAEGLAAIPTPFTEGAAAVLGAATKVIPPIIDQFVTWDKPDQLMDFQQTFDLSDLTPYVPSMRDFSAHASHDDGVGYSSWDYSVDFSIHGEWDPVYFHPSGPLPPETDEPLQGTNSRSWLGEWAGDDVFVTVTQDGFGFDVSVTEKGVNHVTKGVFLSTLNFRTLVQKASLSPTGGSSSSEPSPMSRLATDVVRVQKTSSRSMLTEGLSDYSATSRPSLSGGSKVISVHQFSGDYLMLDNSASLEAFQVLRGGKPVAMALRYLRPTSKFFSAKLNTVDEFLYRKSGL